MNKLLSKAKKDCDLMKAHNDHLNEKLTKLGDEKMAKIEKIDEEEKKVKNNSKDEKRRLKTSIKEAQEDIKNLTTVLEADTKANHDLLERTRVVRAENEGLMENLQQLQDEFYKIRDNPTRFKKNTDMHDDHLKIMLEEKEKAMESIREFQKTIASQTKDIDSVNNRLQGYEKEIKKEKEEIERLTIIRDKTMADINAIKFQIGEKGEAKVSNESDLKMMNREQRRLTDNISKFEKDILNNKKALKKEEHFRNIVKEEIHQLKISKEKCKREQMEKNVQIEKQKLMNSDINDECYMLVDKKDKYDGEEKAKKSDLLNAKKKIEEYEAHISELQKLENDGLKTIKNLTSIREAMARKASAANAEVRQTEEELKIKELFITDLTKKKTETEYRLNTYKALYEDVKNGRNKYVNMIQNSSQDLAELKERIKILQNEFEILKNESSEKDRTLAELQHMIQFEIHERDKNRGELNKYEHKNKSLIEKENQQFNERTKLNMIMNSLNKDMKMIKQMYENACESRNLTGIQLIDRNDELCVLYERANIQESINTHGETEIRKLDDELRMIRIEIGEMERKIDVVRKKLEKVPGMAAKVLSLKNELDAERNKEAQLEEELENPENNNRWRELAGEDPDQEVLQAKIQVLEERLNEKKENLLEKELILDEVTTLAENLRKQAVEGRHASLEMSGRLNDYKSKFNVINRKLLALASELSIFQTDFAKISDEKSQLVVFIQDKLNRELWMIYRDNRANSWKKSKGESSRECPRLTKANQNSLS